MSYLNGVKQYRLPGNQQWKPTLRVVHPAKKGTYLSFPPLTRNKGARSAKTYRGYRRNRDLRVHGAQWIVRNSVLDV
jgi:hypothetical protein